MANPVSAAKAMFDQFLAKADPEGAPEPEVRGAQFKADAIALASSGGKARASKLSPKKRRKIARAAAKARWKKP